jgi:hypothetical protein
MSNKSKFLPVLALAAALAPFAASARSDRAPVQDPSHQQYLEGNFGNQQVAANAHGRAAQVNPPAGLFIVNASPQYAAASAASDEN